jgi:hypothetical protein
VAARQPATPRGLAGVGLTAEEVNRAIARGSEFLWQNLQEDLKKSRRPLGSRAGHDILPAFALVHSEAHRRFPEFDAALRTFLTRIDPVRDLSAATYDIGLLCMLIEAYDDPSLWPQLKRGARYLLETQGPEGSWGYGRRPPPECFGDPVRDDRVLEVQGGHPLDGAGDKPWERRCKLDPNTDGDNSTSQYALLGLHAASRAGAKVEPETWRRVLAASGQRQNADGGWAYRTGGPSYGSMTCAGVCARAIARHQLGEQDPGADEVLERGLGWLNANFTVTRNPPNQQWLYYYLYSLERVGRILDTEFIGEHEWYPVGARHLLAQQKADGSWLGTGTEAHPPVATSFALLFLTRATPTLASEPKRGGDGVLKTRIAYPPGNKYYVILDASGSMLAEMEGRKKFDIAREALAELVKALPDSAQVALRVYGHRKLATEQGASEDTALELSMRPLARADFLAKLEALRARGKTPLARSLLEAKRDLAGAREDAPVTVVFLTDGGEDTMPRQDPIQAAEEFGKLRGIVLHVIGFDIHREDWRGQLEEMTRRAGGRFWPARQAAALGPELQAAVFGVPAAYVVLDGAGREAAKGAFGGTQTLKEGKYTFTTAYAGTEFREEFWVNTGSTTSVTFHAAKVPSGKSGPAKTTPVAAPAAPAAAPAESQSAPAAKKFCTGCGKPVEPKHKFCVSCGARTGN